MPQQAPEPQTNYCELVSEFTFACEDKSAPHTRIPTFMTEAQINFIATMCEDEVQELRDAKTIGEQADAIVDTIYYLCDAAIKSGMQLDPIFDMVHAANMTKVTPEGVVLRDTDPESDRFGKILKPEGFIAPNALIEEYIAKQIDPTIDNLTAYLRKGNIFDVEATLYREDATNFLIWECDIIALTPTSDGITRAVLKTVHVTVSASNLFPIGLFAGAYQSQLNVMQIPSSEERLANSESPHTAEMTVKVIQDVVIDDAFVVSHSTELIHDDTVYANGNTVNLQTACSEMTLAVSGDIEEMGYVEQPLPAE
mgnify:CR=1 FL=1